jgi:1,4-dihydroxy-2-naphthoate octaprenyltransferase
VAAICAILAGAGGLLLCLYSVPDGAGETELKLNVELLFAGFLGFLGSTTYPTGIKFKYRGLGVPFVSFLMGPLEIFVAGTLLRPGFGQEFIMDAMGGKLGPALHIFIGTIVTLPVAALVGVIMHGNDMRDIPTDRAAGIVTFASRLGPRSALAYYRICHVIPYAVCFILMLLAMEFTGYRDSRSAFLLLLPLACLPLTVRTLRMAAHVYRDNPQCPKWRGLERASGGIHFLFGMLYAVSLCLWQIAMFKR